ncbi:hypothetical protein OESDEN_21921, partial [Oesophagostomum dentatum]
SCDPSHFKEKPLPPPSTQADESAGSTESVETTDISVLGSALADVKSSKEKSQEKKVQKVLPPKTPGKEILQVMPTPQSSLDENMTQLSELALLPVTVKSSSTDKEKGSVSSTEKEKGSANAKKQTRISKSKSSSDKQGQAAKKEAIARNIRKVPSSKPKPQAPTTPDTPKKPKKRWWPFW